MPINQFTQPVESTFVNTRPQLPIQSIATAAGELQTRQNQVRDELDELRNTIVESEPMGQNKEVFAKATEGIRDEINAIASEDELFNKRSRVRQLSRDFARSTKVFQQNQQNVQAAMEQLEETEMPERRKNQFRQIINQQGALALDDQGNVDESSVFSGISVGDEADVVQFALDRAKDMTDAAVEDGNFQDANNGLLRRTKQKGVSPERVEAEVLTSLGFAKDPETGAMFRGASSGNPGVENFFSNQRQILQAQGLNEAQIQERFHKKARRIVAQAQNKFAQPSTSFKFRNAPTDSDGNRISGGNGSGSRVAVTGSLSNLPTTSDVTEDHPKYAEVKDRGNLVLQRMMKDSGMGFSEEDTSTFKEVEEYVQRRKSDLQDVRQGPLSYGSMTERLTDEERAEEKFGEREIDIWKGVKETKERLEKEMSFGSRIMSFGADRQPARKNAEEFLSGVSGETLVSPDMDSDSLFGSTESEKITALLSDRANFQFQGLTEDGRYAVVQNLNDGGQQVRLRMDTPGADPVFQELVNVVTGSEGNRNARVLKTNNRLSSLNVVSDGFAETGGNTSLSRVLEGYTARGEESTDVTFENYFDRLLSQDGGVDGDAAEEVQRLSHNLTRLKANGKSAEEVGLTPRSAHKAVITYLRQQNGDAGPDETLPSDMKEFLDTAMNKHIPFTSRGEAHLQAQRFNQLNPSTSR